MRSSSSDLSGPGQWRLFLILTIVSGIIILYPNLNFLFYLSQGDHGRDLYVFKKTLEGALPYRDYPSSNGPLMPYYYAAFFLLFGMKIQSVVLGYNLMILLAGIAVYLAGAALFSPFLAFVCAIWYWAHLGHVIFYTFNHIGAVAFLLLTLFALFRYMREPSRKYLILGGVFILLTTLVRLNIGWAALAGFGISICLFHFLNDRTQIFRALRTAGLFMIGVALVGSLIYRLFSSGTPGPSMESHYVNNIQPGGILLKLAGVKDAFSYLFLGTGLQVLMTLGFCAAVVRLVLLWRQGAFSAQEQRWFWSVVLTFVLFCVLMGSEYFLYATLQLFRLHWIMPVGMLLLAFLLERGLKDLQAPAKNGIFLALIAVPFITMIFKTHDFIAAHKAAGAPLVIGDNRVYLMVAQDEWIKTVTTVSSYIRRNVPPGGKICALPYEPVYYYFTGRDSATRDLMLFYGTPGEDDFLKQLKEQNVQYVILSNRSYLPDEERMGIFGKTYGQRLDQYLKKNFKVVATVGPWEKKPRWVDNHAVQIYKRRR